MTKFLSVFEMLEIYREIYPQQAMYFEADLNRIGNRMAHVLCRRFDLVMSATGCTTEAPELGGTGVHFYRRRDDQPTPDLFQKYDPTEQLESITSKRVRPNVET